VFFLSGENFKPRIHGCENKLKKSLFSYTDKNDQVLTRTFITPINTAHRSLKESWPEGSRNRTTGAFDWSAVDGQ
jgi:hypothetical protein